MEKSETDFAISVIMPTYNRSSLLDYSLQSLVLQDLERSQFEVVVGDDGSADDTREIVRKYEDRLHIRYAFQEDKGYRPASTRNMALKLAHGKTCLFIDSGIILSQDCLRTHIDFHEKAGPDNAAIGYVYGFDHADENELRLRSMIDMNDPGSSIKKIRRYRKFQDVRNRYYKLHADRLHDLPAPWAFFWTGHVSVSRENLFKVGLFDEQYDGRWGVEDNDLGFRLHKAGVQIHLLRSATCIHYPHNTAKPEKERQGLENCTYFSNKYSTPETKLFLQNYLHPEYPDVNLLLLKMTDKV